MIVDSKEASHYKVKKMLDYLRSKGIDVKIESLDVGDYYISGVEKGLLIERSTITDLLRKVRSGALWDQLKRLKRVDNADPLLLIEGSPAKAVKITNWHQSSIVSILNSILLDWQIPYVFSPSIMWTASNLISLTKFVIKPEEARVYPLRYEERPTSIKEMARYFIEGLVGPVSAIKLLEVFKTSKNIVNASLDQLMQVPGIGEKTAKRIIEIVNYEYKN